MRRLLFALAFVAVVMLSTFAAPAATAQTVPPKPVYLAVGDSLTVGLYAASDTPGAWQVADALPQYQLEIAAVTGDGIDNTIAQLPLELAERRPALVTVEVGINNLGNMDKDTFTTRYVRLLYTLKRFGVEYVIACTVPWTGQSTDTDAYARALEFNNAISLVTPALGFSVADCWGATVGHYEYLSSIDGQLGGPTPAAAIADALLQLAGRHLAGEALPNGTWHFAGVPHTSWHGFANAALEAAAARGLLARVPRIDAITSAEYPTPARRPANSRLDSTRAETGLGLDVPDWRAGLVSILDEWKSA